MSICGFQPSPAIVLVVDDDPNMRLLTRATLEPAGFAVAEAEDGPQGIEAFKELRPVIVLLDIVMPSLDGFSACAAMRRLPGADAVPIVMLTHLDDIESIKRAYDAGATDFITKPINWVILGHRIRYMIRATQLANELRVSEAKNRAILDAIPDLMLCISGEGVFLDARCSRDIGLFMPSGQIIGNNLSDVFPQTVALPALEHIGAALETARVQFFEYELSIGGSTEYFEARILSTGEQEVLCMVRNVSIRKRMEEELLKAKKLEAVGILAGGIAHDFNNLLSVILGNINLAQMDTPSGSASFRRLSDAEKATMRARDLTQEFITFSSGGAPLKKPVVLKPLLFESVDQVLGGTGIDCTYKAVEELWDVYADYGQVKQVIKNIVINAKEAMPQGGRVEIEGRNVPDGSLAAQRGLHMKEGPYVGISIKDRGVGIPKEHLQRIFDPYFSTKERGSQKGMGLGLAIAHSILKKHGGYIAVESKPDEGTTFFIYFPAAIRERKPS